MSREDLLSALFEQSRAADLTPDAAVPTVRASMDEPGRRVEAALRAHRDRTDATTRSQLRRSCIEYGARAVAAADAVMGRGELLAQVRPAEDNMAELIAEEGIDRDWQRAEAPETVWRDRFWANHLEIVDGRGSPADLFDQLIRGVGLVADLFAWLEGRPATR